MAFAYKFGDRPLGGYTVQRGVGRGGFGEVYYAISDGGREVALKCLGDNHAIELRGVSACMNLKSPHLVQIFDVQKNTDGEYFIIMEYVSGPSVRDLLIAEPHGLGQQKAAFFVRELAKGLSYLHNHGIVHRDMKPGNIFYDDGYVKIGDYGLSKYMSTSQHATQTASVGTVHYMAPEIGSGHYHSGIDIYALGIILYEMLFGRVPFQGASMGEVLMKHLTNQPEVQGLPEPFGRVITKALQKDPRDRYQNVDDMAEELLGVDDIQQSLAGFDAMSLTEAVQKAIPREAATAPQGAHPPRLPPPHPPFAQPTPGGAASGVTGALRDFADAAGSALKAAAAGVPVGTPEGTTPQLSPEAASGHVDYAGFWIRFVAAFIDALVVGIPCGILGMEQTTGGILLLYQAILIGTWNGQTVGKRALGIKVISTNGCHPTLGQGFGRALSKLLSTATLLIGYVMAAFDIQKRALHDRIAGTYTVYAIQ